MMHYKKALVTGATSGMGEALCYVLNDKGIPLIISGRDEKKLAELAATFKDCITVPVDLARPDERKKLTRVIQEQAPDLVINDAGFGLYGNVLDYSTQQQLDILEVNANALLEISIEAARALAAQKRKGTILNIASAAAFFPFPAFSVYAASKAFVKEFSQAFDFEMAPLGIRILCACPGQVNTKFRESASKKEEGSGVISKMAISKEKAVKMLWDQIEKQIPLRVFDWRTHLMIYISRLFPIRYVQSVLQKNILNRN
ncbi:MAG TPA: SDR family NAD(P)-dependent oxidoreductase [Rhabdochlamydiaceae bacterium]|nr:SDR family NAD(P)-dependent oxidoreductase [Rhabdochlamydiaceae bacterium]